MKESWRPLHTRCRNHLSKKKKKLSGDIIAVLGMNSFYVEVTCLSPAMFMQSLDDQLSLVLYRGPQPLGHRPVPV